MAKIFTCKFHFDFKPSDKMASSVANQFHVYLIPAGTTFLACHISSVIYLITCLICHLQYVTVQKVNERCNLHKTGSNVNWHGMDILYYHFNDGGCKSANYQVQKIERFDSNERTQIRTTDVSKSHIKKTKKTEWMLKLRTASPYGLNENIE